MTEEELKAIEARIQATSAGPWKFDDYGTSIWGPHVGDGEMIAEVCGYGYLTAVLKLHHLAAAKRQDANGVFIANAREDVPALLKEVRRLREELIKAYEPVDRPGEVY